MERYEWYEDLSINLEVENIGALLPDWNNWGIVNIADYIRAPESQ